MKTETRIKNVNPLPDIHKEYGGETVMTAFPNGSNGEYCKEYLDDFRVEYENSGGPLEFQEWVALEFFFGQRISKRVSDELRSYYNEDGVVDGNILELGTDNPIIEAFRPGESILYMSKNGRITDGVIVGLLECKDITLRNGPRYVVRLKHRNEVTLDYEQIISKARKKGNNKITEENKNENMYLSIDKDAAQEWVKNPVNALMLPRITDGQVMLLLNAIGADTTPCWSYKSTGKKVYHAAKNSASAAENREEWRDMAKKGYAVESPVGTYFVSLAGLELLETFTSSKIIAYYNDLEQAILKFLCMCEIHESLKSIRTSVTTIYSFLHLNRGAVSSALRRLEKKGYVKMDVHGWWTVTARYKTSDVFRQIAEGGKKWPI